MPLSQRLVDLALAIPGLEPAADALQAAAEAMFDALGPAKQPVKDALNGTWLGHPAHPPVTDVPVGAWTVALLFDALGERTAAKSAIGLGLLGAVCAATTGLADWTETRNQRPRKLGVVHATLNVGASLLYATSYVMRGRGERDERTAIALSALGYGIVALSALYGGTIAFDLQVGTNYAHGANPPPDETDAGALIDVADGGMTRVVVQGYPVLLSRSGDEAFAISAVCAHQGGPLEQGTLEDGVVTCPWHGSRFLRARRSVGERPLGVSAAGVSRARRRRPRPHRGRRSPLTATTWGRRWILEHVGAAGADRHPAGDRDRLAGRGVAFGDDARLGDLDQRLDVAVRLHDDGLDAPHDGHPARDVFERGQRDDLRARAERSDVPRGVAGRRPAHDQP